MILKFTVAQELEYINAYLYIQKVRYGSKLEYAVSTGSPEILTLLIPRLCIQPLVENAVVHGIEPLSATGHIDIAMELKEDALRITVTDNGVGFDPAEAPDGSAPPEPFQPYRAAESSGTHPLDLRRRIWGHHRFRTRPGLPGRCYSACR